MNDIRYASSLIAATWYFVVAFGVGLIIFNQLPSWRAVGALIVGACILGFVFGWN